MLSKIVTRKWISAMVLTLGLSVAWGVAAGLIGSIGKALRSSTSITSEQIVVAADGTPLIRTRVNGNYYHTKLRTLDGKEIDQDIQGWLNSVSVEKPYREPPCYNSLIPWRERIAGVSSNQNPPMGWLAIRDTERPGHAYFVGYDPKTKQNIGYLGRDGLRSSVPAHSEWFDLRHKTLSWRFSPLSSRRSVNYGAYGYNYGRVSTTDEHRLSFDSVFLVDGDEVKEIDLAKREVRTLAKLEGLRSIKIAAIPLPAENDDQELPSNREEETTDFPTDESVDTQSAQSPFRLAAMQTWTLAVGVPSSIDSKHKTADRLFAQCDDRLVVINPFDNSQQTFQVPDALRGGGYQVYCVSEDQLLVQFGHGYWESGPNYKLWWMDTEGNIEQEKTLQLLGWVPPKPSAFHFAGTGAATPTLLPWLVGVFGFVPMEMMNNYEVETYRAALNKLMPKCWLTLVSILILSIIFTRLVYKSQRKYSRGNTLLWCVTVFLFTWPALMAYWVIHRRPVLEACGECHAEVPRDRDACARCETQFAEPVHLGTEIFA